MCLTLRGRSFPVASSGRSLYAFAGMTQPFISISGDALSASINPLGAELWTLADADGHALMTDANPAFWTGHAPLLFPIVGRLCEDRYRIGGQSYPMKQHGFARRRLFTVIAQDADYVTFRLDADDETRAQYPFDFRLDMHFSITGATLAMEARVTNLGDEDMPFSFGYHPAFAWPLPYGGAMEDHRILFAQAEPGPIRRIASQGMIGPDAVPTPVVDRTLTPTYALFEADALIWDRLESRSLLWGAPGHRALQIDFPDTPMLGLWQTPGAGYLCIEPWAGIADPLGFVGDLWEKPGIMRLPPAVSRTFRMDVTLTGV